MKSKRKRAGVEFIPSPALEERLEILTDADPEKRFVVLDAVAQMISEFDFPFADFYLATQLQILREMKNFMGKENLPKMTDDDLAAAIEYGAYRVGKKINPSESARHCKNKKFNPVAWLHGSRFLASRATPQGVELFFSARNVDRRKFPVVYRPNDGFLAEILVDENFRPW